MKRGKKGGGEKKGPLRRVGCDTGIIVGTNHTVPTKGPCELLRSMTTRYSRDVYVCACVCVCVWRLEQDPDRPGRSVRGVRRRGLRYM